MDWSLKWKISCIESNLKAMLKAGGIKPRVWSFGAYDIDPKHLVFVVGVSTDAEKESLQKNHVFQSEIKALLTKHDWPVAAREHVLFDIESQETVDRETEGNWWYHYK